MRRPIRNVHPGRTWAYQGPGFSTRKVGLGTSATQGSAPWAGIRWLLQSQTHGTTCDGGATARVDTNLGENPRNPIICSD